MHDEGHAGMTKTELRNITRELRAMGYDKIILSSESPPGAQLDEWVLQPRAEDLHHLLAFSSLCLSESITVAGEAAVLGTPTVLLNPLKAGHTLELEAYGLIERHVNVESAMLRVADLSADTSTSRRWKIAKSQLLSDKADMTACLADIILQELKLRNNKVQRRV
jgi:predicted glycosyltransferase